MNRLLPAKYKHQYGPESDNKAMAKVWLDSLI